MLDEDMNFLYHLAVDGQGRAFLLTKNKIYIVDAEGNMIGSIPTEDYITDSASSWYWYSHMALLEGGPDLLRSRPRYRQRSLHLRDPRRRWLSAGKQEGFSAQSPGGLHYQPTAMQHPQLFCSKQHPHGAAFSDWQQHKLEHGRCDGAHRKISELPTA